MTAANLPMMSKKPKYSLARFGGTNRAKKERDSAWIPPCTVPTKTAMHQNRREAACRARR